MDPSTGEIIARSCDQVVSRDDLTNNSSLESCCPNEPVSSIQYDAHEMKRSSYDDKQSYKNVACLHPWGWLEQQLPSVSDSWHPLRHAAIVAIENSAARDCHLFPSNGDAADFSHEEYKVSSPTGSPLKRQKVTGL